MLSHVFKYRQNRLAAGAIVIHNVSRTSSIADVFPAIRMIRLRASAAEVCPALNATIVSSEMPATTP